MREIVLDTETTGLSPYSNPRNRIVEIGCLELINHIPTGEKYHVYINPERSMPREAFAVHGLGEDFLSGHPLFIDHVDEFIDFIADSPLVIHNARFDMKFLNAELEWINKPKLDFARAVDTLLMARDKYPGARNSLDALCKRFRVDNSNRTLHGALLDSELLAEVYLELIGGAQPDFITVDNNDHKQFVKEAFANTISIPRPEIQIRSYIPSNDEENLHQKMLEKIKEPLWSK